MAAGELQKHLSNFLLEYLPRIRGYSPNTVMAYRDTFVILLRYMKDVRHVPIESIGFDNLERNDIEDFLLWLSETRRLSASTCNQRLAAIKSFFRYVAYAAPEHSFQTSSVIAIEKRKSAQKQVAYISIGAVKAMMAAAASAGIRQLALISLLYDSGARVQEICDLKIGDFHDRRPFTIAVVGKGRKARVIPLTPQVAKIVMTYLDEFRKGSDFEAPMFVNREGNAIGRAGVAYILQSCIEQVHAADTKLIPASVTPHMLRHSKAMHLLDNGVNLIYIRDFLGHCSVTTTEVYAKTSPELKRKALESASTKVINTSMYNTKKKKDLLDWLKENI